MELNKLTPRQALIYDALIPPGMPVRGKELARRTRISERDLRSERKAAGTGRANRHRRLWVYAC